MGGVVTRAGGVVCGRDKNESCTSSDYFRSSHQTGVHLEVQWLPYLLDPNTPKEGEDLLEHLTKKYGAAAMERFNKPNNPLETAGRGVGISFNKTRRFINTVDGHRLMEWCNQTHPDRANDLMEHLFRAYFQDAKDLSSVHELVNAAKSAGLPEDIVKSVLESDQYRGEVFEADERSKRNLRVSGVPYFIVENNNGGRPVAFSGAQPVDVITQILEESQGQL